MIASAQMMATQSETGEWREPRKDSARSVRYELKLELRRIERHGRGHTPYAAAIREVLWVLANCDDDHLIGLLKREMSRSGTSDADEPYAPALQTVLQRIDEKEASAHELFTYYLQRLERQGRGDEPFARAIREALASNNTSILSALLHLRENDSR